MSKRKSASKHWDRLLFSHLVPEIPAQTAMFHQILLLKQLTSAIRGSHPGTFHTQMLWLPLTKHFFLTVKKSSPLFLTWEISKRVGDPLVFEMLSQMTSTPNTHVTRIFGFHTWYDGTVTKYKGNTWIFLCSYRHSSWEKKGFTPDFNFNPVFAKFRTFCIQACTDAKICGNSSVSDPHTHNVNSYEWASHS